MLIKRTIRKTTVINTLLSVLSIIVLIFCITHPDTSRYYNKNLEIELDKKLSVNSINLIILTVSGDKTYLSAQLRNLFVQNQILHVLVLSGSNLVIVILYLEAFQSKNDMSYVVLKYAAIIAYFIFSNLQHPLARAVIFMTITDLHQLYGFKISLSVKYSFLISVSLISVLLLNLSLSFALSAYFALAIVIYLDLIEIIGIKSKLLKITLFNLYITIFTAPLILIFEETSLPRALFSNFFVLPIYEPLTVICYFSYLAIPLLSSLQVDQLYLLTVDTLISTLFAYLEYLSLTL